MKYVIMTLLLIALILTTSHAFAGDTLFGGLGDAAMKLRNGMREAEVKALEADGGNFRMYVFTAPGNPNVECVMIAGTQKGGAACYPKANQQ